MSETSRSQVTITLGRSGQVVKRAGAVLDTDFLDPAPPVGRKRSVLERLGSNVDAIHHENKRQCGVDGRLSVKASENVDDSHLSKHDLRFKIMKKTQSNGHQKNVDLRDMLSRKTHSSSTNHKMHHTLPEPSNSKLRAPELTPDPRDDIRRVPEPTDDKQCRPDERRFGLVTESRDGRRFMCDPFEVGSPMLKPYDDRQHILDPIRTSKTLSQMDLSRTSFSLLSLNQIGRRSPNRVLDNSGVLSQPPPPSLPRPEERQGRPMMRVYDDPGAVTYSSTDTCEIGRPMTTSSFLSQPPLSDGSTKPVGPLVAPQLPISGIVQPSIYPVEHLTVEGFLHSLGLDKYLIFFRVEEVDMATLRQMGDRDLKELGVPMGPRKKILLALHARNRRQL